jgi:two-component system sensor histidine kinase KdpD
VAQSPDTRPSPDHLLQQLQHAERQAQRGRLRIYFGAVAGVGKTYAMLQAAHAARKAGADVVVGLLETHGRSDTAALLAGLEQLPRQEMEHRGHTLHEFDLDAALTRHPDVLLVDELAHTNTPGARHQKRWQDIEELLGAGIDVWSTLNVQHLESLNGTVGAITGIRVHETVPDTVLDDADELVLVDVTTDELLHRLRSGKVYLPQQAARAAQNFFRKGNLIALREIALRRTAEHVEDDVRSYRIEQSTQAGGGPSSTLPVWDSSGAILACIGPQAGAEQTVRSAARLAGKLNVQWHAAYVETPRLQRLDQAQRDRILAVIQLAESLGATTAVLTGPEVAPALVAQAQTLNCATLVVGRPKASNLRRWRHRPIARQLANLAPTLDVVEVGHTDSTRRLGHAVPPRQSLAPEHKSNTWHGYAWACAVCVLITTLANPLAAFFDLTNIVMLFLLGVVLVAMRFGRGPSAVAAFLNVAAFDYFFVAPKLSFSVSDVQYVVTFVVMLGVGLLIGQLTAGLQFQARIASSRERRAQALFELSRELSAALMPEQVCALGASAVQRTFGGQAVVLALDEHDQLIAPSPQPEGFDLSVAEWTLRNNQPAGLTTATLSAHTWHYTPLSAPMRLRGVLALQPAEARWLLIPEQRQQLDTLARQIAIALERVHYVDISQKAVVEMESERLRNALLAALSHDVRTPLTAMIGLAETLQQTQPPLPTAQAELARAMTREGHALAALVTNLLDMARLQNGGVHLRSDWQSVEELVGGAIRAARHVPGASAVQTFIPPDLPLVEFDAALMERVLVNLLENAAKYGAPPIEVHAHASIEALHMRVRDHGPGLPEALRGREATLFEKFTRGAVESATPGVGLGLAICKAVVDAHRGHITASNADGGGAEFTIKLPRRTPPAPVEAPDELH